jgi:Ca2+-binding RTX toxin-like protein
MSERCGSGSSAVPSAPSVPGRRAFLIALAVVGGALTAAPNAGAATVSSAGGTVQLQAAPGEANRVSVDTGADGGIVFFDEGATLVAGAGCSDPGDGSVSCPRAGVGAIVVETGDGDDSVSSGAVGLPLTIAGGDGNDQLQGSAGADRLDGGAGHDGLDAAEGADELVGGPGDDDLSAGPGDDTLDGGDGVDVFDGDLGNDRITAGAGDDVADGGEGNDLLAGGDGADTLAGSAGDDALAGGPGVDRITGDEGADTLAGDTDGDDLDAGPGDDVAAGGDGNDVLRNPEGPDRADGGAGDDRVEGGSGAESLSGGDGNDVIDAAGGGDSVSGGAGDDRVDGGDGADVVAGGAGRDVVEFLSALQGLRVSLNGLADDGGPGEGDNVAADVEVLQGADADDVLVGGTAPVQLLGAGGNDQLTGGSAADVLEGGDGDDMLDGGGGADRIVGGSGQDTASYAARTRGVRVTVGAGADDGEAREGDDVAADVERVVGGRGDDTLVARVGVDSILQGGDGDDLLRLRDARSSLDSAICGAGSDLVEGDVADDVRADCETRYDAGRLIRFGVAGAPSPRVRVQIRDVRLGADRRLRVPLSCTSETFARCRVALRITRKGRTFGRVRAEIGRGRARTLRVRLRGAQVALLRRKGGGVRVRLEVRDGATRTARGDAVVAVRR